MKELTLHEMENISGAGLIDLPCALVSFTVQSALGLVKMGIGTGLAVAATVVDGTLDLVTNPFSDNPSDLGSILTNHCNSFNYAASGVWSNFVYNAATDWGQLIYSLES